MKARIDPTVLARTLFDAATTVDVAVAETMTDDYEVGTSWQAFAAARANFAAFPASDTGPLTPKRVSALLREDWEDDGARIHYRVVEHLKGSGPETFTLNGAQLPPAPHRFPPKALDPVAGLKSRLDSRDLSDWEGFGACITALYSEVGKRYLVFRDAEGHLLRQEVAVRFRGETVRVGGPVYAEVSGPDDRWLVAVRAAVR
jgi:hypothetical protein